MAELLNNTKIGQTTIAQGGLVTITLPTTAGTLALTTILQLVYPVGGIYYTGTNHGTGAAVAAFLGFGTWANITAGFTIVAAGAGYTVGTSGGSLTHTHTGPDHQHTGPSHTHTGPSHTHTSAAHSHSLSGANAYALLNMTTGYSYMRGRTGKPSWSATERVSGTYSTSTTAFTYATDLAGSTESTTPAATGADGTGSTGAEGTGLTGGGGNSATGNNSAVPLYYCTYMWVRTA